MSAMPQESCKVGLNPTYRDGKLGWERIRARLRPLRLGSETALGPTSTVILNCRPLGVVPTWIAGVTKPWLLAPWRCALWPKPSVVPTLWSGAISGPRDEVRY